MKTTIKSFDELPVMMDAHHLMIALGLSKGKIYALLNSADFPTQRFGKRLMVSKTHVLEYLEQNKRNNNYNLEDS